MRGKDRNDEDKESLFSTGVVSRAHIMGQC